MADYNNNYEKDFFESHRKILLVISVLVCLAFIFTFIFTNIERPCTEPGCDEKCAEGSQYCWVHDYYKTHGGKSVFDKEDDYEESEESSEEAPEEKAEVPEKNKPSGGDRSTWSYYDGEEYNVDDYTDPEDFYEDYYDDFTDYEDAEDYYNEHYDD